MSVALANFTAGTDGVIYIQLRLLHSSLTPVFLVVVAIQKHIPRFDAGCCQGVGHVADRTQEHSEEMGDVYGVRDVNINIADEEFLVLLGPSGCGKTTTMRMIAGLEDPTEGEIILDDTLMNEVDADQDVAMVFQGYALYPNMTIYENIRFPLRMRGIPALEHDVRVREAAGLLVKTCLTASRESFRWPASAGGAGTRHRARPPRV